MKVSTWTAGIVILSSLVTIACHDTTEQPMSPEQLDAMVAVAPSLSASEIIDDLGLDDGQREVVTTLMGDLHEAMLAVHEAYPDGVSHLSEDERLALHESMQGEFAGLHEKHEELMAALTDQQRTRFITAIHAQMSDHDAPHGLHSREHESSDHR